MTHKKVYYEKPQILLVDFDYELYDNLKSQGYNCQNGSLGTIVRIPNNKRGDRHFCTLNHQVPSNLHEYNIVFINLFYNEEVSYSSVENDVLKDLANVKHNEFICYLCEFPQTIFDPRPLAAYQISSQLESMMERGSLIIVFSDKEEVCEYTFAKIDNSSRTKIIDSRKFKNYDFYPGIPTKRNVSGKEIEIVANDKVLKDFLIKYKDDFYYEITYEHPTRLVRQKGAPIKKYDEKFVPLINNLSDEIISFIKKVNGSSLILFPGINKKDEFINELISDILPELYPSIFPYNTKFTWIKNYQLPNEKELRIQKSEINEEYKKKLKGIDKKIEENRKQYVFLHKLITETNSELVDAIEEYLKWLGFSEITNLDKIQSKKKEEDLQVVFEEGLLIIEVKGIGGTSTDSDCQQISKIRRRRERERGTFDVHALYIVNHQRYKPPDTRNNPTFSDNQINDAIDDERGLLETFELYRLFFWIEEDIITSEDARKQLLNKGLVRFKPSNAICLGKPIEIHHNGTVVVIKNKGNSITKNDFIISYKNGNYKKTKIINIKIDNKDVEKVNSGSDIIVGLEVDSTVSKNVCLWLKKSQN